MLNVMFNCVRLLVCGVYVYIAAVIAQVLWSDSGFVEQTSAQHLLKVYLSFMLLFPFVIFYLKRVEPMRKVCRKQCQ